MQEEKPSHSALTFEGAKLFLKQDSRGYILSILVHPQEVPMELMTSPINTRYTVAMVEMADDGSIVKPRTKTEGEKLVASAAMLCENPRFSEWLHKKGLINHATQKETEAFVRKACEVESRSELKTDKAAAERFKIIRAEFAKDVDSGRA